MNLAVADMLVGLFFTPQYVFMHLFTHPDGVTGTVLCRLLTGSNVAWVGAATSVFTLVVIAIERNIARTRGNLALAQCKFASYESCKQAAIIFIRVVLRFI